jgi:hypothetical protein
VWFTILCARKRARKIGRLIEMPIRRLGNLAGERIECRLRQSEGCTIDVHSASLFGAKREAMTVERLAEAEDIQRQLPGL